MIFLMLKRLLIIFGLFVFLFSPQVALAQTASPTPSATPDLKEEEEEIYDFESMSTYELFWPLVAGKIPGDGFYQLKKWRDNLMIKLFFSKLKKAEYLKQLANKRLIEAEKLLEVGRDSYLSATLKDSLGKFERGLDLVFASPENELRFWLEMEYKKDLQKYLIVLMRMKDGVGDNQKETIGQFLERVENLAEKHNLQD